MCGLDTLAGGKEEADEKRQEIAQKLLKAIKAKKLPKCKYYKAKTATKQTTSK